MYTRESKLKVHNVALYRRAEISTKSRITTAKVSLIIRYVVCYLLFISIKQLKKL